MGKRKRWSLPFFLGVGEFVGMQRGEKGRKKRISANAKKQFHPLTPISPSFSCSLSFFQETLTNGRSAEKRGGKGGEGERGGGKSALILFFANQHLLCTARIAVIFSVPLWWERGERGEEGEHNTMVIKLDLDPPLLPPLPEIHSDDDDAVPPSLPTGVGIPESLNNVHSSPFRFYLPTAAA